MNGNEILAHQYQSHEFVLIYNPVEDTNGMNPENLT